MRNQDIRSEEENVFFLIEGSAGINPVINKENSSQESFIIACGFEVIGAFHALDGVLRDDDEEDNAPCKHGHTDDPAEPVDVHGQAAPV